MKSKAGKSELALKNKDTELNKTQLEMIKMGKHLRRMVKRWMD